MTTEEALLIAGQITGMAFRAEVADFERAAVADLSPTNRALVQCVLRFRRDLLRTLTGTEDRMPAPQRPRPGKVERELYRVVTDDRGHLGIRCARCGLTSWHDSDVRHAFCGNCRLWLLKENGGWPVERRDG